MSYSFTVRAATKAAALAKVAVELDKVVASQPIHAADCAQAQAAAEAFLGVVPDDASKDVLVSVNGYVGWRGNLDFDAVVTSASVSVSASMVAKETA